MEGEDYPAKSMVHGHRNSRLWTHRRLSRQSFLALEQASFAMQGDDVWRKQVGGYALTLIYPTEISRGLTRSRLREHTTEDEVYDQLISELPISTWRPVVGEVGRIEQYRNSIGVAVQYPDFKNERAAVREILADILKIQYRGAWHSRPHVSFARGPVSNITNFKDIRSQLPETFDLSPVYDGFGHMI
jgi:hypothetical protein